MVEVKLLTDPCMVLPAGKRWNTTAWEGCNELENYSTIVMARKEGNVIALNDRVDLLEIGHNN